MKKILTILTITMTMSIVLFGFVNRKQNGAFNSAETGRMVRFIIDHPGHTSGSLYAQVRAISTTTGMTAYDRRLPLTRENGKYVTTPLMLVEGSYRVEATTYSRNTATTFSSTHNVIVNHKK
jgi:hypothetical protein